MSYRTAASRRERLVADFPARCRATGLHLTPQRQAIYEALAASSAHPSAEQLHAELRERVPSLSLATVYKTLEALTRVGLIGMLNVVHERARYDAETARHHHLVCERCKEVVDVHDPSLDALRAPAARRHGFSVRDHSVHFYGLCALCAGAGHAHQTRPRS